MVFFCVQNYTPAAGTDGTLSVKMDLILRSIERRLRMQFSMARKFLLRPLRRYDIKPNERKNRINLLRLTRHALSKLNNTGGEDYAASENWQKIFKSIIIIAQFCKCKGSAAV